ncbi:MAG: rod shape-determining protein RodA [Cytophagales bacterium CG12_big_fil_rev_8_21_14_0_65_40_12]|nr:MAG: rod shape-determining protein RodA [Cytophagales bacterium CG12_big_fil_rev_8_21_14_0_65_40_12]PIW06015.1 MAG: rod shape-determining protein RodA [Cytophagales bacterium CG17_big_fil_post_rev_8_21_14_2_50_40_13]
MRKGESILKHLDWSIVLLYVILVIMGWFNIFASVYDPESASNIFDLSLNSGRQLLFIGGAVFLIIIILLLDFRIYESFAPALYVLFLCLLIGVLVFGTKINGARAWFDLGIFRFQPAEFTKLATALLLARYISTTGVKLNEFKHQLIVLAMIALPVGLILLQPDTGSAMVFAALIIPLYREGFPASYLVLGFTAAGLFILTLLLPQIYIIIGLAVLAAIAIALTEKTKGRIILIIVGAILCVGFVFTTDYLLNNVLKGYQKSRIEAIFRPELVNPKAEGWNLEQSKIAIGSGGFAGKGFLEGTQTKYGYVPEQSTDFIFSTLAEEHGWIGSAVVIVLFLILMIRIISIAERQKFKFARFYGYAVASILFFHFTINIAMTIGLFPVVGIPLPFFSYGGSSLWSFTVMLFVLLKMDMHRSQVLTR